MPVNKAHDEFYTIDLETGWETPPGYPAGIQQKILAGGLNETSQRGTRTRLLRFAPGVYTTEPFVHDYWEEVFLVTGDLTVGNDKEGKGGIYSSVGKLRSEVSSSTGGGVGQSEQQQQPPASRVAWGEPSSSPSPPPNPYFSTPQQPVYQQQQQASPFQPVAGWLDTQRIQHRGHHIDRLHES